MAKRQMLKIETTIGDAVSTAFGVIEELAGEMREAYDNTPESLQESGVGEARGEAADTLEGISEPDVPDGIREQPVKFELLPLKRRAPRADRLSDGLQYAQQAIEAIGALMEEMEAAISEIQDMIDEAEGMSFPGMLG